MQKEIAILISSFFVITLAAAAASTSPGTISGVVVDDSGGPISGASVVYRSVPPLAVSASGKLAPSGPVVSSYVSTSADGAFAIANLPLGNYNLCAYGVTAADLGSCEWVQGTTHVALASAQTVQVRFHVSQGVLITFQVADTRQQIVSLEDLPIVAGRLPLTGANFGIGIWAGSRYVRAGLVSKIGTTREYQLAIPKTAAVRLFLDTSLAALDANSVAIPLRQAGNTITPGGEGALTVNITIP